MHINHIYYALYQSQLNISNATFTFEQFHFSLCAQNCYGKPQHIGEKKCCSHGKPFEQVCNFFTFSLPTFKQRKYAWRLEFLWKGRKKSLPILYVTIFYSSINLTCVVKLYDSNIFKFVPVSLIFLGRPENNTNAK